MHLVAGNITRNPQTGVGHQAVAVVPSADALLEACLLREGHRLELDVGDTGSGADPDPVALVGKKLLDLIIRQVTQPGQILAATCSGAEKSRRTNPWVVPSQTAPSEERAVEVMLPTGKGTEFARSAAGTAASAAW